VGVRITEPVLITSVIVRMASVVLNVRRRRRVRTNALQGARTDANVTSRILKQRRWVVGASQGPMVRSVRKDQGVLAKRRLFVNSGARRVRPLQRSVNIPGVP